MHRSDISYYLNSHHIDFHEWCVGHKSRPVQVTALASTGELKGPSCSQLPSHDRGVCGS